MNGQESISSRLKKMSATTIVLLICVPAVLGVVGYGYFSGKLFSEEPVSLLKTGSGSSQVPRFQEETRPSRLPEQQAPMQTPVTEAPSLLPSVPLESQPRMAAPATALAEDMRQASEALAGLRNEIEELAQQVRGEGMARISNADLEALVTANARLQEQVDVSLATIRQAKEEKELALKQVAELDTKFRELAASKNTSATSESKPKASSRTDAGDSKKSSKSSGRVAETRDKKDLKKELPFQVVGMTDSFIVVKQGAEFKTMKVGDKLEGVALISVNPSKNRIKTDMGEFAIK